MEQSFIAWLQGRQKELPQVRLGIGDDAAILDPFPGPSVISVDTVIDGVDFLLEQHGAVRAGRKALAVNLSDMAAMAAKPIAIVVALSLPEQNATRLAGEVFEGIIPLAKEYGVAVAGGDISCYHGPLSITITIIGEGHPRGSTLRSGAQPGDALVVTGSFGGSISEKHLDFSPRVSLAQALRSRFDIHAAIDVSDGLSLDLDRLCAASSVGVELDLESVPISEAAVLRAKTSGLTPFEHAWGDGEDFELILAVPADQVDALLQFADPVPRTKIGTFTGRTGLWAKEAGSFRRLSPQGFIHGQSG